MTHVINRRQNRRVIPGMAGALALMIAAAAGLGWLRLDAGLQIMLLLGGLVGLLLGAGPRGGAGRWRFDGWLIAVLLVAFAVRLDDLGIDVRRHVDEMHAVRAVVQFRDNSTLPVLLPYDGVPEFTRAFSILQAGTVNMLTPSLAGLRLPSVFFGLLTVAATYALAAALFGRRAGLLAALFLATFPPHLHFSRLGLNNIADPFFGVLTLALLARRRFAMGGAALGFTQYWYEGGRLLYPPLGLAFALMMAAGSVRPLRRLARFAVVALIAAAPVYLTLAQAGLSPVPRLRQTAAPGLMDGAPVNTLGEAVNRVDDVIGVLLLQPEPSWFYAGDTAIILPWIAPLILAGLGAALLGAVRWRGQRRAGGLLLLLWTLATVGGQALLTESGSARLVVYYPGIAILGALAVDWLARSLPRRANVALVGVAVLLAGSQVVYYFAAHLPLYIRQYPEQTVIDDVYFRTDALPDNTHVLMITPLVLFDVDMVTYLQFTGRLRDGVFIEFVNPEGLVDDRLVAIARARNAAFFVAPGDDATQARLRAAFPEATFMRSPFDDLPEQTYLLMFVPRIR
ncbi:MAG: hypothetical protein ACOCXZ_01160 [Chloroflexota bacterium]